MIASTVSPELVRGIADVSATDRGMRLHRLPEWVRRQFPDGQLLSMEAQPSGARLVMRTTARSIELVTHPTRVAYRGADRPRGCFDIFVDDVFFGRDVLGDGDVVEVDFRTGDTSFHPGPPHTTTLVGLPDGDKRIEIWLPHNEAIEVLGLTGDAPIESAADSAPLWVHHGSSISQGSNAAAPSEIWPAVAARLGRVDLRNLGFGGSAIVDPFMSRVIRDSAADLISIKLGINVVNADAMRLRAFVPAVHGFLDTIRDGHPETPIVLISPIFCGIHEDTPGPAAVDLTTLGTGRVRFTATGSRGDRAQGRLTLTVIRRELQSLVERRADDANLHYLDGTDLYGPADADELPLPDDLHPGPAAHRMIGERFAGFAFAEGGPFREAVGETRTPIRRDPSAWSSSGRGDPPA